MMKTLVAGLMAIAMTMGAQSASAAPFLGAVAYIGNWALPNATGFDDNTDLTILSSFVASATGSFGAPAMDVGNPLVHATPLTYRLAPVVPAGPLWTHVGSGVSFVLTSFAVSSVSDLELELTGSGFFTGAGFDDTSGFPLGTPPRASARSAARTSHCWIASMFGHTTGMNGSEKIAVSLPDGLAERARRAVRQGRATSVSAYVASALAEKIKLDDLSALLEEMLAETGGPLTARERRAADRALGVQASPSPPRRRAASKPE